MPFFFDATKIRIGRRALLRQGRLQQAKPFSPASIPKSGPEIKNRCTKDGVNGENLTSIPKSGLEIKNRCTKEGVNGENLASILKFGHEIKNRCTKEGVNGENLTSIPKSSPEIKNRCTQQGINRQNLALILKFGPEIENRCTKQPIFSTHPQHIPPARVPARVPSRVDDVSCLGCSAWGRTPQWFDSGSTVAAKAGADAPGGGISLCFCRRGCAAPAQKPPRSTPCRNERTAAAKTHPAAKITVATKSSAATKNPSRRCVHHPRHQDGLKYLKESDYSA